jgi:hypothetical protein
MASNLLGVIQLFELVELLGAPHVSPSSDLLLPARSSSCCACSRCSITSAVDIAIVTASVFDIMIVRPPFELQLLSLQFLALSLPFTRLGSSQLAGYLVQH